MEKEERRMEARWTHSSGLSNAAGRNVNAIIIANYGSVSN